MNRLNNLKKGEATRFKSGEKAAKAGRKGGIRSGESKREHRLIANVLRDVLDEILKDGTTRGESIILAAIKDVTETGDLSRLKAVEMIQRVLGEHIIKVEQPTPTLNIYTTPKGADALKRLSESINNN